MQNESNRKQKYITVISYICEAYKQTKYNKSINFHAKYKKLIEKVKYDFCIDTNIKKYLRK